MEKTKLKVVFEKYVRYGTGGIKIATVERETLLEALKVMCDKMGLYIDSEVIEENNMTVEDIVKSIDMSNGDGCDYIFELKNITTDEVLVKGDCDFEEVEW